MDLVNKANRYMPKEEEKKEITKEQMEMAIAITRNFNHDATQPYTPAEEFNFHRVEYEDKKGTHWFVCTNYQIKEQMITFYDVRTKREYIQNDLVLIPKLSYKNNHNEYCALSYDSGKLSNYAVSGYQAMECKTIARERVLEIDSLSIAPKENFDWYTISPDMAREQCAMKTEKYNTETIAHNKNMLSEESLQKLYDFYIEKHKIDLYYDMIYEYRNSNWIKKLFMNKPNEDKIRESITKPHDNELKQFISRYKDILKKEHHFKEYDWGVFLKFFGDEETPEAKDVHGNIIEAEYEPIEP